MGRVMRRIGAGRQDGRTPSAGRSALAVVTALCAVAVLPGTAGAQDGTAGSPYVYADRAQTIEGGASDDASADLITLGETYKSSIGPQGITPGQRHYRLNLNATDNAYVSVTVVPNPGSKVISEDGVDLSIWDSRGDKCSDASVKFDAAQSPRPIATAVSRTIDPGGSSSCQEAGTFYLHVERVGGLESASDDWGLELHGVSEPALRTSNEPTTAPDTWNTSSPALPVGAHGQRHGGKGFSTAATLRRGTWRDQINPGETLFYRVPVGWGQQFFATAEVTVPAGGSGSSGSSGSSGDSGDSGGSGSSGDSGGVGNGLVDSALVMALYNPVRGFVAGAHTSHQVRTESADLPSLPPVAYENRYAADAKVSGMRFGGSYYLTLSLNPRIKDLGEGAYDVTLRVNLRGGAQRSPDYMGEATPQGTFTVMRHDEQPPEDAQASHDDTAPDGSMRLLAVASFSAGGALLLILVLWTLSARWRAPRTVVTAETETDGDQDVAVREGGESDTGHPTPGAYGSPGGW